jgi:hypothetical protein
MGRQAAAVSPMVRRATQLLRNGARNRWVRLASQVDKGLIRRPHYVHEHELTDAQRDDIATALQNWLRHPVSGRVERDPGSDLSVAYHAGFVLAASWLLFSGTEAPELGAVFDRHRIDLHPDWWLDDGWGDYHDQYGVHCAGEDGCGSYTYAVPNGIYLYPHHMDWPQRCRGCGASLPMQHRTQVFGADATFWSDCSCGWATDKPMTRRHAKGAATRHVNAARAAEPTQRAVARA